MLYILKQATFVVSVGKAPRRALSAPWTLEEQQQQQQVVVLRGLLEILMALH
jgi:hypothetical protein